MRGTEDRYKDIITDKDENDERNTEVNVHGTESALDCSNMSGKNSIKKNKSIGDREPILGFFLRGPYIIQKRLHALQSDDTSKKKRRQLCSGARIIYCIEISE